MERARRAARVWPHALQRSRSEDACPTTPRGSVRGQPSLAAGIAAAVVIPRRAAARLQLPPPTAM